jgi:hypothetical protein
VENTLSQEQRQRVEAAAAERARFQPKTPAERVVGEIDRLLLLDPKQRQSLVELATKTVDKFAADTPAVRNPNLAPSALLSIVRDRLPAEELQAIFSETQLSRWKGQQGQANPPPPGAVDRYQLVPQPAPVQDQLFGPPAPMPVAPPMPVREFR